MQLDRSASPREIREAYQAGASPAEVGRAMLDSGGEYPDVFWAVSNALNLDRFEIEELQRDL